MLNFSAFIRLRLSLGKVIITQAASEAINSDKPQAVSFLVRHHLGDWGEGTEHDALQNDIALLLNMRVWSRCRLSTGQMLWIITEANRSITKISLASEEFPC